MLGRGFGLGCGCCFVVYVRAVDELEGAQVEAAAHLEGEGGGTPRVSDTPRHGRRTPWQSRYSHERQNRWDCCGGLSSLPVYLVYLVYRYLCGLRRC